MNLLYLTMILFLGACIGAGVTAGFLTKSVAMNYDYGGLEYLSIKLSDKKCIAHVTYRKAL